MYKNKQTITILLAWKSLVIIIFYQSKTYLSPVVQSVVSLTYSLVVKMLTVVESTISNSQIFLLKKCEKLLTFFSAKILAYMPYLMIKILTICYLTTLLVWTTGPCFTILSACHFWPLNFLQFKIQCNFNDLNTDGLFTMANSNLFLVLGKFFRQLKKMNI